MNKLKSILPRLAALEGSLDEELARLALLRKQGKLPLPDGEKFQHNGPKSLREKIEEFRSRIMDLSSGCWRWSGATDALGYGNLKIQGLRVLAHRFSFAVFNCREPQKFVCHKCDNPNCVNPDHLFEGSQTDNMHDCSVKGRFGDRKGEANACRKLDDEAVRFIRNSDLTGPQLALMFGVSRSAVFQAKSGATWSHVTP